MSIAAQSTILGAQEALEARMGEIAAPFSRMKTKSGAERAPTVFGGWLPNKTPTAEQFPFIAVRPTRGSDAPQGADEVSAAAFDVVIGVWEDSDDGFRDLLILIDAIRLSLASAPVLAGAIEHVGPLEWEVYEEQPVMQWLGRVTLNLRIPRPQRVEARNP